MTTESDPSWKGAFTIYAETIDTARYSFVFGSDTSNIRRLDFPNRQFQSFLRYNLGNSNLLNGEFDLFFVTRGYSDSLNHIESLPGKITFLEPHRFSSEQDFFNKASAYVENFGRNYWIRNKKSSFVPLNTGTPFYFFSKDDQEPFNEGVFNNVDIPKSVEDIIIHSRYHVHRETTKSDKINSFGIPFIKG
ncbi:hypothetical protein J4477_02435 [Candidatus Pacearchaeota archaeon]|nr:hypothetical protein [Candidatus Pacearchaeota archaeon]